MNNIKETNLQLAKEELSHSNFIENDILISDDITTFPVPEEARRMTFILVALCTDGTAQFSLDTEKQSVKKNDVIIITDKHIVDNFKLADDTKAMYMMISVNFFYETIRNVSEVSSLFIFSCDHPVVSLSEQEASIFVNYFHMLRKKVSEVDNHFRRNVVRTLILAMFYDMGNVIYREHIGVAMNNTRANTIFTNFIALLQDNYKRERRVGWYAEQMGLSAKYMSIMVKMVSKRTPNEWIDNYVTLEIRVQLRDTDISIKDIASNFNFINQSYLGKYFKEHVGISPSAYRKGDINMPIQGKK